MAEGQRQRRNRYYLYGGLGGLVLFFLSILFHEQLPGWLALIMEELGVVLFVTVAITATVGEYSLGVLTREVEGRLTDKVNELEKSLTIKIRKVFGDPLLAAPLESVFDPDFVRRWYKLTLALEPLEGQDDLLKVSVTSEYVLENVSGRRKEFQVAAWLDDILRPNDEAGFRHFKWGSPGKGLTALDFSEFVSPKKGRISLTKTIDPPIRG